MLVRWIGNKLRRIIEDAAYDAAKRVAIEELHNIQHETQRIALRETAEFVLANVPLDCVVYKSKDSLLQVALNSVDRQGLFLEFGVYSGASINRIAELQPNHTIYGFDSFEGLPESFHFTKAGAFKLDDIPNVRDNVQLVKGWFDETLPSFLAEHGDDCAFVHIDCDLYASTKAVLTSLRERLRPGCVILFDEFFNYPNWRRYEFAAFSEFVDQQTLQFRYLGTTYQSAAFLRSGCHQVAIQVTG